MAVELEAAGQVFRDLRLLQADDVGLATAEEIFKTFFKNSAQAIDVP
jgi:hypothetical protein